MNVPPSLRGLQAPALRGSRTAIAIPLLLLLPIPACALPGPPAHKATQSESERFLGAESGFYIGAMAAHASVGGDFDGNSALVGGGAALAIPEVDAGTGWGLILGVRSEDSAVELNYQRTSHDITFLGASGKAEYDVLSLDLKRYFIEDSPVQPHLVLGLSFPSLVVEDGSVASSGSVADAKFRGLGANLGAGVTFYPHRRVSLSVQGGYRLALFTTASGANGVSGAVDDSLDGSGPFASFGFTFTF